MGMVESIQKRETYSNIKTGFAKAVTARASPFTETPSSSSKTGTEGLAGKHPEKSGQASIKFDARADLTYFIERWI